MATSLASRATAQGGGTASHRSGGMPRYLADNEENSLLVLLTKPDRTRENLNGTWELKKCAWQTIWGRGTEEFPPREKLFQSRNSKISGQRLLQLCSDCVVLVAGCSGGFIQHICDPSLFLPPAPAPPSDPIYTLQPAGRLQSFIFKS